MRPTTLAAALLLMTGISHAATGKLPLTGGVSSIDGAAGGGLTPWALVGTQAAEGEWGVSGFVTGLKSQDYRLAVAGLAWAWNDRIELSLAQQDFDTRQTGDALGLPGLRLRQGIAGIKLRLAGEAILDSDNAMPQIAIGVLAKRVDAGGLAATLQSLGARRDGVDIYLSATKLLLGPGLLLNATLRATKANQNGLLGFGSTAKHAMRLMPEFSIAWLLRRDLVIGAEYRAKPDNLSSSPLGSGLHEDAWADLFVAWAPSKQWSITAAWVDLGHIVPAVQPRRQSGAYLSLQLAF